MKFTIDVVRAVFSEFRLKKDGSFGEIKGNVIMDNDLVFDDYYEAKKWKKGHDLIEVKGENVKVNPSGVGIADYYVMIRPQRINKPNRIYITKDHLKTALQRGDDSTHNSLVIDFAGDLHLMPLDQARGFPYAVRFETFQAGNGYVGSSSNLYHLDRTYLALLQGWAEHLASSQTVYRDYADSQSEEEVIEEILKYIDQYK